MIKLSLVVFFFLQINLLSANDEVVKDTTVVRLLQDLQEAANDTARVNILKDLGLNLLRSNPEESRRRANEALELAEKLNYPKGIAAAYNLLALYEEHIGNYTKTVDYYLKSLKIIEKEDDKENIANIYSNIGSAARFQQDYEKSIKYLTMGVDLFKEIDNSYGLCNCYNTLGTVYRETSDFEKAIEYHEKAVEQAKKAGNDRLIAITSLNLAGDMDYVANFDEVVQSFNEALASFIRMDDKKGEAIALNNLGSAYMENKKSEQAIDFLLKSIEKAQAISYKALISHNYWLINNAYSDFGDYKSANEYALLLNEIGGELMDESRIQAIAELETKYEVEKKEQELLYQQKEIEVLEKDQKLKNYTLFGLLSFVILLVISALGWFRNYKNKRIVEENAIRHQLDMYIKEIELLKNRKETVTSKVEIEQSFNLNLVESLSERELEVFDELSKGKTNKEMAEALFVSVNTIKTHLKSIYDKLDVKNRTQAVKKVSEQLSHV